MCVWQAVAAEGPHDPFQGQKDESLTTAAAAVRDTIIPLISTTETDTTVMCVLVIWRVGLLRVTMRAVV